MLGFLIFNIVFQNLATEIILTLGQAFEVAYQLSLISQEDNLRSSKSSTPTEMNKVKRLSYIDILDN